MDKPEITASEVRDFLCQIQGKEITLAELRKEFGILPNSKSFNTIRNIMFQLAESKTVRPSGKRDGTYKVITQVKPVRVFTPDRERRLPFNLMFPKSFDTMMEMNFADQIVIREGDLITIGGVKSSGKTTICLNFCASNIDLHPILMGNEYTISVEDKYEPAPRFYNRVLTMGGWVDWTDAEGLDKFTLFPVSDDYAEHIVPDRLNIIDWISLDGDKLYDIGRILKGIKSRLGRGVAIIGLQKGEGAINPRGGQFVRDFSDLEILLDSLEDTSDVLLTIKGVKESKKDENGITHSVVGKTYAYSIYEDGTQIMNFREVKKCPACNGQGWKQGKKCEECFGRKFLDK